MIYQKNVNKISKSKNKIWNIVFIYVEISIHTFPFTLITVHYCLLRELAGIRIIITQVTNIASAGWAVPASFWNCLQKHTATEILFFKQARENRKEN
jgi:hypothetical protein